MKKIGTVANVPLYGKGGNEYPPEVGDGRKIGFVFCDGMPAYKVAGLCATVGAIDESFEYILCYRGEDVHNSMLMARCARKGAVVLYDSSSTYDDIAVLRSTDIECRDDLIPNNWNANQRPLKVPVLRQGHGFHIPSEKNSKILRAACKGALNQFVLAPNSFASKKMSGQQVSAMASAMSFGKVRLDDEGTALEEYLVEQDGTVWEHPFFSLGLALANSVEADCESRKFIDECLALYDVYGIWQHCFATSKLPLCFDEMAVESNQEMLMAVGGLIGAESCVDAYFGGVPIEDILA